LKKGEKCAIVSGFNASGIPHLGQLFVFDTNRFFQREYGVEMFIPISDDESYVSQKVKTQEEGLKNSLRIARMGIALGFIPEKTHMVIDQLYTNIYNMAIKLSRGLTLSEIRDAHGYTPDQNAGLHFYPAVQSSHILLPQTMGFENVLVPIGPDEDTHLRICRGLADKFGFKKPAALHGTFLPGVDGRKMSKSWNNAIYMLDSDKEIKRKVMSAFSGGRASVDEHRRLGGNPSVDIPYIYLKAYFLKPKEADELAEEYKKGRILSGEMKNMLYERIMDRINDFNEAYKKVNEKMLKKAILANEEVDLDKLLEKYNILE